MTFAEIVNGSIVGIGNMVITILYGLAFLLFLFGVMKLFFAKGEEGRTDGKKFVLWGIIGLTVLFGVWGLVKILLSVLTSWNGA